MCSLGRSARDLPRPFFARLTSKVFLEHSIPVVHALWGKRSNETRGFSSSCPLLVQLLARDDWLSKRTTSTTTTTPPPTTTPPTAVAARITTTTMAGSSDKASSSSSGWSDEEGDEYLAKALASDEYLQGEYLQGGPQQHIHEQWGALGRYDHFWCTVVLHGCPFRNDVSPAAQAECYGRSSFQGPVPPCRGGEKGPIPTRASADVKGISIICFPEEFPPALRAIHTSVLTLVDRTSKTLLFKSHALCVP